MRRVIKQIVVITEAYHFSQPCTRLNPASCYQVSLHMQKKLLGIISVDYEVTGELLILYSAFMKCVK